MSAVPEEPPPSDAVPDEPSTFGAYRLADVVVSDLVSVTYRASPLGDPQRGDVALRLVADRVRGNSRAVKGFLHVNQRIAEVDHPHLLQVVDVGTHDGTPYTATAWRNGLLLADLLLESAPLDAADTVRLCGQLAEALDTAHANGIVHGTVGLSTVWIKRRPGGRVPPSAALTGFGTSHLLAPIIHEVEDAEADRELLFVAPEQLNGEPAGPAADQYALACTMFTMVTGTTPFRGESNNDLFGAHLFSAPPAASSVREGLAAGWDEVFATALAKDPNDRYDNCRTLLLAAGQQTRRTGGRPSQRAETGEKVERQPVPVRVEIDEDDDDESRRRTLRIVLLVLLVLALLAAAVGLMSDVGGAETSGAETVGDTAMADGAPDPSVVDIDEDNA